MCRRVSCTLYTHRLCVIANIITREDQHPQQEKDPKGQKREPTVKTEEQKEKGRRESKEYRGTDEVQASKGEEAREEPPTIERGLVESACPACADLVASGLLDEALLQNPISGCNLPPTSRLPAVLPPQQPGEDHPEEDQHHQMHPSKSHSRSLMAAAWGLRLRGSSITPDNARIESAERVSPFRYSHVYSCCW